MTLTPLTKATINSTGDLQGPSKNKETTTQFDLNIELPTHKENSPKYRSEPNSVRSAHNVSPKHIPSLMKSLPEQAQSGNSTTGKPRYGNYESIKHHLNFFLSLHSTELDTEFHLFNTNKKSGGFIIAVTLTFLCVLLPLQLVVIYSDITGAKDHRNARLFFSCLSFLFIVIMVLCGVALWGRHRGVDILERFSSWSRSVSRPRPRSLYMTRRPAGSWMFGFDLASLSEESEAALDRVPPVLKEQWDATHAFYYRLNIIFAVCIQHFFTLMYLRKTLQVDCHDNGRIEYDWYFMVNCYDNRELIQIAQTFAMLIIMTPLIMKINLPDIPMELTWWNMISSIALVVLVGVVKGIQASISLPLIWTIVCFFTVIDAQTRDMLVFFANKHLSETLEENERMAEENRAEEMRHMLGNVAHDLKTPLSSFSTGADLIQQTMHDFRARVASLLTTQTESDLSHASQHCLESVLSCVSNMRSTNAFMTMTINRCIEYTKVTKGGRLQPKHETVNLADALQLPLSCMRNIQERISISIASVPADISVFVITDKQWLQENVLCLLSNAVKYSLEGSVVVRLSLQDKARLRRRGAESSSTVDSKADPLRDRESESSRSRDTDDRLLLSAKVFVDRADTLQDSAALDKTLLEAEEERLLLVEVEDTGIGVPAHLKNSLFKPFNQTQKMAGGTGLGLFSLAKRVETLHGEFGVRDREDGVGGSVFWFAIPYQPDDATAELALFREESSASQASHVQSFEELCELYGPHATVPRIERARSRLLSSPKASTGNPPGVLTRVISGIVGRSQSTDNAHDAAAGGGGPRALQVLLVDDTASIVKMASMLLRSLGHRVTVAGNGAMAVKLVRERFEHFREPFDLALMDLQMPVMDGLEATRRIRDLQRDLVTEGERSFHQRIVGMSANTDDETRELAMSAGMDEFVGKPLTRITFTKVLECMQLGG